MGESYDLNRRQFVKVTVASIVTFITAAVGLPTHEYAAQGGAALRGGLLALPQTVPIGVAAGSCDLWGALGRLGGNSVDGRFAVGRHNWRRGDRGEHDAHSRQECSEVGEGRKET